MIFAILLANLH